MAKERKRVSKSPPSQSPMNLLHRFTTEQIIVGGIALMTVLLVVIIFVSSSSNAPAGIPTGLSDVEDSSLTYPIVGRDHIPENVIPPASTYNSNPPTSGPHFDRPLRAGIYTESFPDQRVIHNMEHGHVWLSYRDANDSEAINFLSEIQRSVPQWVIVTYRPANPSRIAVASWGRLLPITSDELNTDEIYAYIQRYRNRAPESIPG